MVLIIPPSGVEHVERIGLDLGVGSTLEREQPDLRPVAVADDELVLHRDGRQRLGGDAHVAALVLGGHGLSPPQERVAAQGSYDQHAIPL
jgi:hypothetical protein